MTYRERREARVEKLGEWADKRDARSDATFERAHEMASHIPFGQPILVGHHSEGRDRRYRQRIRDNMDRAVEDARKAESMRSRAANISDQLAGSIYDDDPDAIERLEEKLAGLEAERERVKAHNRATRGAKGCTHPEGCACRARWDVTRCGCDQHPMPTYVLSNLGGNISRTRDRLERLRRQKGRAEQAEANGGVVVEHKAHGYCVVTFAEKPDRTVIDALKDAGFRWAKGSWVGNTDRLPQAVQP